MQPFGGGKQDALWSMFDHPLSLNMQQMREMEVGDLTGKTLDFVSHSLDKPTLNSWEYLMQSPTFRSIYSTDDIEKIRLKSGRVSPAVALIQDLVCRKTPLEDLMSGLRDIENNEAILIIENGKSSTSHGLKHIVFCFRVLIESLHKVKVPCLLKITSNPLVALKKKYMSTCHERTKRI